jgi:hypothetical protein
MGRPVFLVTTDAPLCVLAAYSRGPLADRHSRCITGAGVLALEVLDELPDDVIDMIGGDFEDDDTPVEDPPPAPTVLSIDEIE